MRRSIDLTRPAKTSKRPRRLSLALGLPGKGGEKRPIEMKIVKQSLSLSGGI